MFPEALLLFGSLGGKESRGATRAANKFTAAIPIAVVAPL